MNTQAYEVFRCLPSIPDAPSFNEHADVPSTTDERLTTLFLGHFLWLVNIQLEYLVCTLENGVVVKPCMVNQSSRQFGYDHLYVGIPTPDCSMASLILVLPGHGILVSLAA